MSSLWVLASTNAGKLAELNRMVQPSGKVFRPQSDFHVPATDEPYPTFLENALHKARHASLHTGLPALADDSGLCVPALGGQPGVHSARFAGDDRCDARNVQQLLHHMVAVTDRRAYFYCVLVAVRHPDDPVPIVAEGLWQGTLAGAPQGSGGFGYDAIFYPVDCTETVAQLASEWKEQHSHRAQAIRQVLARLAWADGR